MRFRWLSTLLAASLLLAFLPGHPAAAATASGRIGGVVRDENGTPQGDAKAVLVDRSGQTVGTDTTGSDGRYSISVAPGQYDLAVVTAAPPKPRIARVRSVDVAGDSELDVVVLPPYATASGTVRDTSGAPLPGVQVNLGGRRTRTDPEGRYSLQAHPGTYSLELSWGTNDLMTSLSARVEGFTLTEDRAQDLTFAVTQLTIEGRSPRGEPLAVAGANVYSPWDCGSECRAGFELFPGSGEARGSWHSCCQNPTVPVLPGDLVVTVTPANPAFAQVTAQSVAAPWANPLPIVMPDAPPPVQPPAKVTWKGVVRHNGVPVPNADLSVGNAQWDDYAHAETDNQGRFEVRLTPGHQSLTLSAFIGTTFADDSGGPPPGLHLEIPDFEVTTDRTMDINIPTEDFAVTVVDPEGRPAQVPAYGPSFTRSLDTFPGGRATATVQNTLTTDAAGRATFVMFPDTPPQQVSAGWDGFYGWADVAPADRSVTVRLTRTPEVTLSGCVRDARGPLPLVNQPWVSFDGQASGGDFFNGSFIDAAGRYGLDARAGRQTLIISDLPDHDDQGTADHVATPTLPEVWTITTEIDLPASKTLDLTIPDAAPARFRAADSTGVPLPAHFQMNSSHRINLGSGLTGTVEAETLEHNTLGPFEHMMFGPARVDGLILFGMDTNHQRVYPLSLRAAPGDHFVLAMSSNYDGGDLMPPVTATAEPPTPQPQTAQPDPGASTASNAATSGYWALSSDGTVFNFGDAPQLGDSAAGAVDLEPTPSGKGYWTLNKNGNVQAFGDAAALGNVDTAKLGKGEEPASLSATPTGIGYWVFTNRGRVIAFGDAPHLGDMSQTKLNGPVLGSVATPSGKGYYMVASDGGIFAFGDAAFTGSMGGKKLNAPVQSLVPDSDGKGYWLVASDGGIFAFDAPFRGSMGGTRLNKPVVGMVRYGDGYLMVGADGGIFNFSSSPFAGSLGDKPPASPVVAVAALP